MKLLNKFSVLGALMLGALSSANAVIISYDDLVVAPAPGITTGPWLSATITNNDANSVHFLLSPSNLSSGEFLTDVFFSLSGSYSLGSISSLTPSGTAFATSNCNGKGPAGTGPWQLCFTFSPASKYSSPNVSFDFSGVQVSNFVSNAAGWFSVAHLQGIQPNGCSTWIGAYNNGTVSPQTNPGTCGDNPPPPSVPEPGTLSLIGLALAGFGGMRALRNRKAA